MGIRFQCHHCGHQLHVKDFQAGRKGRCPVCQGAFRIPLSDAQYSLDPSANDSTAANAGFPVGQSSVGPNDWDNRSTMGQSTVGGVGNRSSGSATASARMPSTKLTMAKAKPKEEVVPSEMLVKNERPDMQGASGIDQIQPQVIVEAPDATWYVRPASGGQYGPAPAAIVWQWLIEDRIGHDSLVWREDWPDWLSATQVFGEYFSGGLGPSQAQQLPEPLAAVVAAQVSLEPVAIQKVPMQPVQPNESPAVSSAASSTTSGTLTGPSAGAGSARELRKRNRRMKYSVAIAVLGVILVSLAIGLVVVLYQQGVLGGASE